MLLCQASSDRRNSKPEVSAIDVQADGRMPQRRRRVLIVVSSFSPAMNADLHRARMLCFDLPKQGWEVEVLTPDASHQRPETLEPSADLFYPRDLVQHAVQPLFPRLFDCLGVRNPSYRGFWPMYKKGASLLASKKFDLVYFSTTCFVFFCLGSLFRWRFGIPYVLDFQDPWYRPEYKHIATRHWIKWHVTRWMAKFLERLTARRAAGIVAVSPRYIDELIARYSALKPLWIGQGKHEVIPFAASEDDLRVVRNASPTTPARAHDGPLQIAYVGIGGATRSESFRILCEGLASLRRNSFALADRVRIDLHGTMIGWQAGDRRLLQEIADGFGVGELVCESPTTVTYHESLQLAEQADGLLVLGVDDVAYMPSKLFSYLLFGKPVLLCLRDDSPPATLLATPDHSLGHIIRFGPASPSSPDEITAVLRHFVEDVAAGRRHDRRAKLQGYLSSAMCQRHVEFFERCLNG